MGTLPSCPAFPEPSASWPWPCASSLRGFPCELHQSSCSHQGVLAGPPAGSQPGSQCPHHWIPALAYAGLRWSLFQSEPMKREPVRCMYLVMEPAFHWGSVKALDYQPVCTTCPIMEGACHQGPVNTLPSAQVYKLVSLAHSG